MKKIIAVLKNHYPLIIIIVGCVVLTATARLIGSKLYSAKPKTIPVVFNTKGVRTTQTQETVLKAESNENPAPKVIKAKKKGETSATQETAPTEKSYRGPKIIKAVLILGSLMLLATLALGIFRIVVGTLVKKKQGKLPGQPKKGGVVWWLGIPAGIVVTGLLVWLPATGRGTPWILVAIGGIVGVVWFLWRILPELEGTEKLLEKTAHFGKAFVFTALLWLVIYTYCLNLGMTIPDILAVTWPWMIFAYIIEVLASMFSKGVGWARWVVMLLIAIVSIHHLGNTPAAKEHAAATQPRVLAATEKSWVMALENYDPETLRPSPWHDYSPPQPVAVTQWDKDYIELMLSYTVNSRIVTCTFIWNRKENPLFGKYSSPNFRGTWRMWPAGDKYMGELITVNKRGEENKISMWLAATGSNPL